MIDPSPTEQQPPEAAEPGYWSTDESDAGPVEFGVGNADDSDEGGEPAWFEVGG